MEDYNIESILNAAFNQRQLTKQEASKPINFENLTQHFGLDVVVAVNHFTSDTDAEIKLLQSEMAAIGVKAVLCKHWAKGAEGALDLAIAVLNSLAKQPAEKLNAFSQTLSGKLIWIDDKP